MTKIKVKPIAVFDENGNNTGVTIKVTNVDGSVVEHTILNGTNGKDGKDGECKCNGEFTCHKDTTDTTQPETGNVVIKFVDATGKELGSFQDSTNEAVGEGYNTKDSTEEYPETMTIDGKTYKRVLAGNFTVGVTTDDGHLTSSAPVEGAIVANDTLRVVYVYKEVAKTSSVITLLGDDVYGYSVVITDSKGVKTEVVIWDMLCMVRQR